MRWRTSLTNEPPDGVALGPGNASAHPEIAGSAAFDRAEYSLQQGSIVIALVVGGTALACVGALRLRNAGFTSMPLRVAAIALVSGVAVVGFGIALIAIGPPSDDATTAMPRATLAPSLAGDDLITGKGVRGTVVGRDDDPVEGVGVTLVPLFMEDGVDPIRATTDDEGRFAFDDVTVDPGSPWVAEAKFDGARFPSEVMRAPRGKDHPLRLVVAETTKKAKDLDIEVESLAVGGDRSGGQAVHALLPGATAIQEGTGLDRRYLALGKDAMTSTAPILPGRHDLTYTYIVQMARGGIAVGHRTQLPTERYELLVGDGLSLRAYSLRDDGEVQLGPRDEQRTYHRYVARNLKDGDRIDARVTTASSSNVLRIAGLAVAVLLGLAVVFGPLLRRRRREREPSPDDMSPTEPGSTPVPGGVPPVPPA
jgi:hypothetical protein